MVKSGIIYHMTKSITYINYNPLTSELAVPYLWLSFQAHIEENYPESAWLWNESISFSESTLATIIETKPALILTSMYTWSYDKLIVLLKEVKKHLPDTTIIVGGPHQIYKVNPAWFKEHPFIDYVCREDGYGEAFLTAMLKALDEGLSMDTVPFCIYPTENRLNYKQATTEYLKRGFKWPSKVFERFANKLTGDYNTIFYESSRGCPYKCTYCEWSGGTGDKVSFKPTELILEDIDFLLSNFNLKAFEIIDANFGIIPRDIDIIKAIIAKNPKLKINIAGPTKTNSKHLLEIYKLLTKHSMLDTQTLAIQETSPEALKNILRKNLPLEDHMSIHRALQEEFPEKHLAEFELILGLPGATLDSFFDIFKLCNKYHMAYSRHKWKLLPTSPAAAKEYVEEYQIKVLSVELPEDVTNYRFNEVGTMVDTSAVDIVVGTYSYSKEDWITMYLVDCMAQTYYNNDIIQPLANYLGKDIIKDIYYNIIPNLGGVQSQLFDILMEHTINVVELNHSKDLSRVDISATKFKILIYPKALFSLLLLINPANFFLSIHKFYGKEDKKLLDLCHFLIQMIKSPKAKDLVVSEYKWDTKARLRGGLYHYAIKGSKNYDPKEYLSGVLTNYTSTKLESIL